MRHTKELLIRHWRMHLASPSQHGRQVRPRRDTACEPHPRTREWALVFAGVVLAADWLVASAQSLLRIRAATRAALAVATLGSAAGIQAEAIFDIGTWVMPKVVRHLLLRSAVLSSCIATTHSGCRSCRRSMSSSRPCSSRRGSSCASIKSNTQSKAAGRCALGL